MDSSAYMTCALKVNTQTAGWHKSLINVLGSVNGVTYSIDAQQGIAYISGRIDPGKLLKLLAKSEKHAEICWVDSGNHNTNSPRMPFNGYGYEYPSNGHGYNTCYNTGYGEYPYGRDYYYLNHCPQQRSWHYSYYDQPYPFSSGIPFYEPSPPRYFPQAPEPKEGFNVGDPQWCSIM